MTTTTRAGTDDAATPTEEDPLEALAERLDDTTRATQDLDPLPRQLLADQVEALNALHRNGLRTIVRALKDDPRGKELLFELVDDPGVHMLLAMHGIVRPDPMTAAETVLDTLRPGLASHGGDVTLDHIEDGTVYVQLQGACNGCSMAAVTMREGIEKALVEQVPGIIGVTVLPNQPSATLIPLSEVGMRPPEDHSDLVAAGWARACSSTEVPVGTVHATTVESEQTGKDIIVVNAAGQMAAYVNSCAHMGRRLDDAIIDGAEGTLTCRGHGFCYDSTNGECLSMPGAQLESLPLRIEGDEVWVRVVGSS